MPFDVGVDVSPISSEDIVAAIKTLAESQGLREAALKSCQVTLKSCAEENGLGGWSLEEIEVHFNKCSLVFEHGILSYPFIDTHLGLYVRETGFFFRDLRPIGYYRLITFLDGTPDDDYFVIDEDKIKQDG